MGATCVMWCLVVVNFRCDVCILCGFSSLLLLCVNKTICHSLGGKCVLLVLVCVLLIQASKKNYTMNCNKNLLLIITTKKIVRLHFV